MPGEWHRGRMQTIRMYHHQRGDSIPLVVTNHGISTVYENGQLIRKKFKKYP